MDSSGKDRPQDNPQERSRTELCAHNSTEDRTKAGNVQKLNHKNFPGRHRNVIDSVLMGVSWGCTGRVHPEDTFYKRTVDKIAGNKSCQAADKGYHYKELLECWSIQKRIFIDTQTGYPDGLVSIRYELPCPRA